MQKMKAGATYNGKGREVGRARKTIHPIYGVRTDIPPEVVCALSEGQVSLAWTPTEG
jgi:hypothetical protein